MSTEEENHPVPNWLLKLEEQRERRLKVKLGHEAGAGAKCQKCEDKCPGLDLHFWRKICKACKCGKEDHDIIDDDIYGYVQFQLLGSKPVKSKGVFLKGLKDEVILEWTPKGSSTDIKKYLDELPADMIPVKGSEGAKIRKQRLQKQMPAHDIDASLCHQLTEDEIKEMEEYVCHIRKNCVGQGKIIRLSLFKGSHHKIPSCNTQFLSQIPPAQIASSQTVFLQSSDMTNNLHNMSLRDPAPKGDGVPNDPIGKPQKPAVPNFPAQNIHPVVDNQTPAIVGKITDMNYYPSGQQNVVHPLTTSNVERHQEQYEIQNANFDKILNPHLNYAPNYLNPVEQHQLPAQVGQPIDLKYPVGGPNPIQNANVDKVLQFNPNYVNTVDQYQVGQPTDLKYPTANFDNQNVPRFNNADIDRLTNPLMQYNPNYVNPVDQAQIPTQVGQLKDINYPVGATDNLAFPPPINTSTHPLMQRNLQTGPIQETQYPQNDKLNPNFPTINNANKPLQQYNPNFGNPTENVQLPSQIGQLKDLKYPSGTQNLDQINSLNANQIGQYPNYQSGPIGDPKLGHPDYKHPSGAQTVDQLNPVNANQIGQYPNYQSGPIGDPKLGHPDYKHPSGAQTVDQLNPVNANQIGQYPNYQSGPIGDPKLGHPDYKHPSGAQTVDQLNPVNANQIGQYPNYQSGPIGDPKLGHPDYKHASGAQTVDQLNPLNANQIGQYPNYQSGPIGDPKLGQNNLLNANIPLGQYNPTEQTLHPLHPPQLVDPTNPQLGYNPEAPQDGSLQHSDLKSKPLIPILEAQSAINPFESYQNLQSVGYIRDIDYPTEYNPQNSNLPPKTLGDPSMDQNSNQAPVNHKCHNCQTVFEDGSVAISVDRTVNLWHAKCFNCETCKQPLADLLYFYHKESDNIYCGRDYAILKGIPRCLACDELIFVREYCLAEDNTFHIKHFCCFECDEPLAGQQYILENNQPVCISCYENLKAEKCRDCGLTIRPDQQGVSLQNLHWHAVSDCFACKKCRKSLLGSKMLLRNQNLFCSDVCFKSFL